MVVGEDFWLVWRASRSRLPRPVSVWFSYVAVFLSDRTSKQSCCRSSHVSKVSVRLSNR